MFIKENITHILNEYSLGDMFNDMFEVVYSLGNQYQTCFISQISTQSEYLHIEPQVELLSRKVYLGSVFPVLTGQLRKEHMRDLFGDLVEEVVGLHFSITKGSITIYFGILEVAYYIAYKTKMGNLSIKQCIELIYNIAISSTRTTTCSKMNYMIWLYYIDLNNISIDDIIKYILKEIFSSNIEFRFVQNNFNVDILFDKLYTYLIQN